MAPEPTGSADSAGHHQLQRSHQRCSQWTELAGYSGARTTDSVGKIHNVYIYTYIHIYIYTYIHIDLHLYIMLDPD